MPLKYLFGEDKLVANFIARMSPHDHGLVDIGQRFGKAYTAIGVCEDDELIAGMAYFNFNPKTGVIELAIAALPGRLWLTRQTLALMARYPFEQCRCQMIMTWTTPAYQSVLRMLAISNFDFITIPRLFGRGQDCVVCLLTAEAWAASKFGKRLKYLDNMKAEEAA
jgi:hypothetical protein